MGTGDLSLQTSWGAQNITYLTAAGVPAKKIATNRSTLLSLDLLSEGQMVLKIKCITHEEINPFFTMA